MRNDASPDLTVRVDPSQMVRYVRDLITEPRSHAQWGDTAVARAAQLRWAALNRAFGDARVMPWTTSQKPDQLHVPAALIAAAGVARLTMAADEVIFDIPTLVDTALELCDPAGHA
jgi:hypothetical protein